MFRSYEPGRDDYVTLIANYLPLQDAYGGPNYFTLDPRRALRHPHRQQRRRRRGPDLPVPVHATACATSRSRSAAQTVSIPLINAGPIVGGAGRPRRPQRARDLHVWRGPRRRDHRRSAADHQRRRPAATRFDKPVDNIGTKTIPDYDAYADQFIYDIDIPGCGDAPAACSSASARSPSRSTSARSSTWSTSRTRSATRATASPIELADKNVTSIALEVPVACLTDGNEPVIGGWTTAPLPRNARAQHDPDVRRARPTHSRRAACRCRASACRWSTRW